MVLAMLPIRWLFLLSLAFLVVVAWMVPWPDEIRLEDTSAFRVIYRLRPGARDHDKRMEAGQDILARSVKPR